MHVLVDGANVGRFSTFKFKGKGKKKGKALPPIDLAQICSAMSSLREQFKNAEVTLFLFENVIDEWERRDEPGLPQILAADANCITKVPSRSDVDEFILQEAIRLSDAGGNVRIITNDNFDVYVVRKGHKAIDKLSKERLQQWLCKFTFSRGRFVLQPSTGEAHRASVASVASAQDDVTDMDVEMTDRSPVTSCEVRAKWEDAVHAFTHPMASNGTPSSSRPVLKVMPILPRRPASGITAASSQTSSAPNRAACPAAKKTPLQKKPAPSLPTGAQGPLAKAGDKSGAESRMAPSTAMLGNRWKQAENAWNAGEAAKKPATSAEKRDSTAVAALGNAPKKRKISSHDISVDADVKPAPTRKFIYDTSHPDFKKPPSWDKIDEILGRKRPRRG
eukprot:GEMP01017127.1.p1 GENE.GEMP01017127.1~~GEMP01017127.1.p1  ORF type:complete len:391 (-),score=113.34 GEMP01017127.1:1623-2795(-)